METERLEFKNPITTEDFNELAKSIGYFIMKFETMVEAMRREIMNMCTVKEIQEWPMIDILLSDLTAEPLLKKFEAMFQYCCVEIKNKPEVIKLINEIYSEVNEAIKFRNKVAHAHWQVESHMNWETNTREDSILAGTNARIKKRIGVTNSFNHKKIKPADEINGWTQKVNITNDKILKLAEQIGKCEKTKFIKF